MCLFEISIQNIISKNRREIDWKRNIYKLFAITKEFLFVKISWKINLMMKRGCNCKKKKREKNIFMHANYLERSFYGESTMLEEKYLSNV